MLNANPSHPLPNVSEIIEITSLVMQTARSHEITDGVTVVRGYAELSVMFPATPTYRDALSRAAGKLSELLEGNGHQTLAIRIRGVC